MEVTTSESKTPRSLAAWAALTFSSLALLIFPLFSIPEMSALAVIVGLCTLGLAIVYRSEPVLSLGLFLATFLLAFWHFAGSLFTWPLHLLVPLLGATLVAGLLGSWHEIRPAFFLGQIEKGGILLAVLAVGSSICGLFVWRTITNTDLSVYKGMIPGDTLLAVALAGLGFSLLNAILEEVVWRGIILTSLSRLTNFPMAAFISSLSFGIAHIDGVPSGTVGMIFSFIYGLILCLLAWRSKGILLPILAHIIADIFVFSIIYNSQSLSDIQMPI